jgi:hypothetical protein
MATEEYSTVLMHAQNLSLDEQLRLLEDLAGFIRMKVTGGFRHSILEFEGLGKEIWEGIDVQAYIDQERDSWDKE